MSLQQDVGVLQGKCEIMEENLGVLRNGIEEANQKLDALHDALKDHETVLLRVDEVPDLRNMIYLFRTARTLWTKAFLGLVILGMLALAGWGLVVRTIHGGG